MELAIHILEIVRMITFVLLVVSVIVAVVWIGIMIQDEISDMRKVVVIEHRKRKDDDDDFFTHLISEQREFFETTMDKPLWKPKHAR
jgi:hypothetical protein